MDTLRTPYGQGVDTLMDRTADRKETKRVIWNGYIEAGTAKI